LTGPATALSLDALTYLLPIASVIWLLKPNRSIEQLSSTTSSTTLKAAWKECGPVLRHVLKFTGLICIVGFFHPGLAPLIAADTLGPSPQDLGLFTSVLAAGSITGGIVLQRNSHKFSSRPGLSRLFLLDHGDRSTWNGEQQICSHRSVDGLADWRWNRWTSQ
jgi:hypothetical protein